VNEFEVDRFFSLLSQEEIQTLKEIAKQDDHVKEIMNWVSHLPDMTQDEIEEQIIKFDKQMIENQGLEDWLKQEQKMSNEFKDDERYKKRIAYLTYWAKENNFEKPKWERM
jgi:hypothetical protein